MAETTDDQRLANMRKAHPMCSPTELRLLARIDKLEKKGNEDRWHAGEIITKQLARLRRAEAVVKAANRLNNAMVSGTYGDVLDCRGVLEKALDAAKAGAGEVRRGG